MKGMIAFASLLLLFAGAFADSNVSRPDVLGLKYDLMGCRVDAVITLVEYGMDNTNVSGGDEIITVLEGDMETLGEYADAGDRLGFNSFVIGTLREDLRNATIYLKDAKKELFKGGGAQEAHDYFVSVVQDRAECIQGVALDFAQGEEIEIEKRLEAMNQTIGKLRNKSVDTSEMEDIYAQGMENFQELQDAIDTGNASTIYDTVQQIRGEHLHIWARFHIAKVRAILDTVDEEAIAKGYGDDVDEINGLLDHAAGLAAEGRPYNPGEFDHVKDDLKDAHELTRELIKNLRGNA